MKKLAQFIKILGDANRLTIIYNIGYRSRSVSEIIGVTGLSQTLVSFHLRALRDSGIVTTRRDGPFIYYSLLNHSLIDTLDDLVKLAGLKKNDLSDNKLIHLTSKAISSKRR